MSFLANTTEVVSWEWRQIPITSETQIQNKGTNAALLLDSATQPDPTSSEGFLIVQAGRPGAIVSVPQGSTTIWARAIRGTSEIYVW